MDFLGYDSNRYYPDKPDVGASVFMFLLFSNVIVL